MSRHKGGSTGLVGELGPGIIDAHLAHLICNHMRGSAPSPRSPKQNKRRVPRNLPPATPPHPPLVVKVINVSRLPLELVEVKANKNRRQPPIPPFAYASSHRRAMGAIPSHSSVCRGFLEPKKARSTYGGIMYHRGTGEIDLALVLGLMAV